MAETSPKPKARDAGAFKGLLVRMNLDGWRTLRLLAAERDTTLNALALEAINDLFAKYGKERLAKNPLHTTSLNSTALPNEPAEVPKDG